MKATFLNGPLCLAFLCIIGLFSAAHGQASRTYPVTIQGDHFVRDGKPYQIISGAIRPSSNNRPIRSDACRPSAISVCISASFFWNS